MKVQEKGIKISTGAPDIAALGTMEPLLAWKALLFIIMIFQKMKSMIGL